MKLAVTLIVAGVALTTAYGLTLYGTIFGIAGPVLLMAGVGCLLATPGKADAMIDSQRKVRANGRISR